MPNRWIAVVTRTGARIYRSQSFRLVEQIENELGREKNRAFTTSRPSIGRNRTASRSSTHNTDGESSRPHDEIAKAFARTIALYLGRQLNNKEFEELLVAAEPRMMGWLKGKMNQKLKGKTTWMPKDLAKLTVAELRQAVRGSKSWQETANSRSSS
jgi:protein required for attachment to host cells